MRIVLACVAGLVYAVLGCAQLATSHPEEDAYILFRYVDQWLAGNGIVFFPGGPPTEGATDFLWFVLIAGLGLLGVDPATAAVLWNAAGAAIAAAVLLRLVREAGANVWFAVLVAAACITFHGALAGYRGFSSMLFAAAFVLGMQLHRNATKRSAAALPLFALGLGLLRPEGFVAGAALVLVGLPNVHRLRAWRAWTIAASLAAALFAAYLAWKVAYFGSAVPTAAHVKSHSTADPELLARVPDALAPFVAPLRGLTTNWRWLLKDTGALPFVVAIAVLAWLGRGALRGRLRPLLVAYAPCFALLAVLTFTEQTQNVYSRFQAPATLGLGFVVVGLLAQVRQAPPIGSRARTVALVVAALAFVPGLVRGVRVVGRTIVQGHPLYTHDFAPALGELLGPERRFALTEAGILAWHSRARLLDAVGLNTAEFAQRPVRVADLRSFAPDVVMCHHSFVLDLGAFGPLEAPCLRRIEPGQLATAVLPAYRWIFDGELCSYEEQPASAVPVAATVIAAFLASEPGYDLFLAGDRLEDLHVWGIRRAAPEADAVAAALEHAVLHGRRPSYYELLHAR